MADIANKLTLAAFNWRGNPSPYSDGLLGDVGSRYATAFDGTWPAPGADRSLAFEYFVGLVFNGDYDDLAGFTAMVAAWLFEPQPDWILQVTGRVLMMRTGEWLTVDGPHILKPDGRWPLFNSYLRENDWQGGAYVFGHATGVADVLEYWAGFEGCVARVLPWPDPDRRAPEGEYEYHGYWGDVSAFLSRPTAEEGEGGIGFKPEVLSAVRDYVAAEKEQDRDFPDVDATAATDNGYIFANWATDKYGSPVAR